MIPPPTRPPLEVVDIVRAYGEAYRARHAVLPEQATVMRRLAACRTAALGGHVEACQRCGYRRIAYNSCRDRHCPKCQAVKRAEWLESRLARLLLVLEQRAAKLIDERRLGFGAAGCDMRKEA